MPQGTVSGTQPLSKNALNAGKRAAKLAKKGPICHGGTCSSCGQTSSSCTPKTAHAGCKGYYEGNFGADGSLGEQVLTAARENFLTLCDGTLVRQPIPGTWLSEESVLKTRLERAQARINHLASQRVINFNAETKVITFANGLGDPIFFLDNKWKQLNDLNDSEYHDLFPVRKSIIEEAPVNPIDLRAERVEVEEFFPDTSAAEQYIDSLVL